MQWYQDGKVKVVIDEVFPLSATVDAINKLMSRMVKGKVIIQS